MPPLERTPPLCTVSPKNLPLVGRGNSWFIAAIGKSLMRNPTPKYLAKPRNTVQLPGRDSPGGPFTDIQGRKGRQQTACRSHSSGKTPPKEETLQRRAKSPTLETSSRYRVKPPQEFYFVPPRDLFPARDVTGRDSPGGPFTDIQGRKGQQQTACRSQSSGKTPPKEETLQRRAKSPTLETSSRYRVKPPQEFYFVPPRDLFPARDVTDDARDRISGLPCHEPDQSCRKNDMLVLRYFDVKGIPCLVKELVKHFDVKGIPCLVILGPDGKTVTRQGRNLINLYKENAYPFTDAKLELLEKKMDEEAKSLPRSVYHGGHRHELNLVSEGNGGGPFICCDCDEPCLGFVHFCILTQQKLHLVRPCHSQRNSLSPFLL
ncbi:hypothetical protein ACLB2K_003621 [Fragaria x ananassa]